MTGQFRQFGYLVLMIVIAGAVVGLVYVIAAGIVQQVRGQ